MYRDKKDIERRDLPCAEVRLADNNDSPKVVGYAARFNEWADIGGMFKESIAPGAFKKTLQEADVRALVEHDPMAVIGRNKAGTLRLNEDEQGLAVEIDIPDTSVGRDLLVSLRRGDKSQMSFGFTVNKADDDYEENTRILRDVSLFDVSVVTYPAYPTTTAQVRSAFQASGVKISDIEVKEPSNEFNALDETVRKIKAKEELTEDDHRALTVYLPPPESPAKHSEADEEPAASHSTEDTRGTRKIKMLLAEAELMAPAKPLK
jgi:uncharacterized protein